MTTDFLHGVEVIELPYGPRPIEFKRSSVIGLIGTAPDSEGAASASLTVGSEAMNNGITFTAASPGVEGNNVALYLKATAADQTLDVSVQQAEITITLATDSEGVATSTASDVITAVGDNNEAAALVTAAAVGASDGSGLMPANNRFSYLLGGLDEAFPLNTPTLVAGRRIEAARMGKNGTLPRAIDAIFDHASTLVVVVRVAEGIDDDATLANFIGSNTGWTGVHAFMGAEASLGIKPKILIAPNWSHEIALATEMDGVANRLRAIAIVDGPNTTDADVIDFRGNFGSSRVYIVDPQVKVFDVVLNAYRYEGASARAAGVMAENDRRNGWHTSPSNKMMRGIVGTKRPIDFALSDPSSRSNVLNEQDVTVVINHEGWRLWGNRTTSADPQWQFINVRRAADMAFEALEASHLWAVDRNITRTYIEDVTFSVQRWIDQQTKLGHFAGGHIAADPELNTAESLASGQVYFNVDIGLYPPAERITFRAWLNNEYLTNVLVPET